MTRDIRVNTHRKNEKHGMWKRDTKGNVKGREEDDDLIRYTLEKALANDSYHGKKDERWHFFFK